jgi:Ca2+/H+ antiporter
MLGDFTEEVALHTNQTIGGLLNATFGNAVVSYNTTLSLLLAVLMYCFCIVQFAATCSSA